MVSGLLKYLAVMRQGRMDLISVGSLNGPLGYLARERANRVSCGSMGIGTTFTQAVGQ